MIKVDEVMKNSKIKQRININIKRCNEKREKRQKKNYNKNKKKIKFFVVISLNNIIKFFTSDFTFNYTFRFSWILNYDSNIHVVNKTMKQRFQKKRNCTNEFMMISNIKSFFILIYDRMRITINTFTKKKIMKLLNVSYVSNFIINIVADSILVDKKFHFNTTHDHFHKNDTFVVLISRINAHYVFENNKIFKKVKSFAVIVRKIFTLKWHQFFVHANNDVIQHLQQIVEKMKFINKNKMFLINECEKCVFFKIHKIVSRSLEKLKISNKSFYRIIYDFIDITTTLNKHKWISHVACFEIDFHMIYTHKNKKSIIKMLIWVIYIIKTRYKKKWCLYVSTTNVH